MLSHHPTLRQAMADPTVRLAHLLWHGVRENWLIWELLYPEKCKAYLDLFPDGGKPNPSLDLNQKPVFGGGAGRDFLYMHREMILHANHILQHHGEPPIVGWKVPPAADDPVFRVPCDANLPWQVYKSRCDSEWKAHVLHAKRFVSDRYLKTHCIDHMGTAIEYGIHAAMHERFACIDISIGLRSTRLPSEPVPVKWDAEKYDTLLDPYAAHVHPWFWCIHGWVDDRVNDWGKRRSRPVDWGKPWMGPMADLHAVRTQSDAQVLEAKLRQASELLDGLSVADFFRPRLAPSDV